MWQQWQQLAIGIFYILHNKCRLGSESEQAIAQADEKEQQEG